jgi:hypothetical protein
MSGRINARLGLTSAVRRLQRGDAGRAGLGKLRHPNYNIMLNIEKNIRAFPRRIDV